jgi:phosphohistidine phosphatase
MMTKTLVIARHAKSDWALGLPDHDRPLNSRGEADAPRMGKALINIGFMPDLIVSSTAVRARSTADLVAREISYHLGIKTIAEIYEEGHGTISGIIQDFNDRYDNVMLFGHNPTLEQLAAYLLQMQGHIILPTSGMICLEAQVRSWAEAKPGDFHLKWFIIPKILD